VGVSGFLQVALYKLSARGEIETLKVGKRAVVRRSDIERLPVAVFSLATASSISRFISRNIAF
jgi:hypothetical protein